MSLRVERTGSAPSPAETSDATPADQPVSSDISPTVPTAAATSSRPAVASDNAGSDASPGRSWQARPMLSRALRIAVACVPFAFGSAAAIIANNVLTPATTSLEAITRTLIIVALSTVVVRVTDIGARRFLPLAALLQLSLVFPDQAPDRFKSALKAGSSRRLERAVEEARENGLAHDPGDAARQVVELIGAIGDHDRRTRGHSERVRLYADLLGEELKLTKVERQKLQWGALLHDLGKLMVPDEVLNKKGKPTDEEWATLQRHPSEGMRLIEPLRDFLGEWVYAIGGHHEKWDGSGYPLGLRGHAIPRAAAIVAVADSFEVMTAVRSYKRAMSLPEARAELTRSAGTHFSPEIVRAFLGISLGRLQFIAGPLSALAHVPFIGNVSQVPSVLGSVAPNVAGAVSMPAAAIVSTAALAMGSPALVSAEEVDQAAVVAPETTAVATVESSSAPQPVPTTPSTVAQAPAPIPAPSETAVATTPEPSAAPPLSANAVPSRQNSQLQASPPTQATPATVAPNQTSLSIDFRTAGFAANESEPLDGVVFGAQAKVVIQALVSEPHFIDRVVFHYPDGQHATTTAPFYMLGANAAGPIEFTTPAGAGNYVVTMEVFAKGATAAQTVSAEFRVDPATVGRSRDRTGSWDGRTRTTTSSGAWSGGGSGGGR